MNMRKTKIICTLGPAVDHAETIERLIRTGMNAARFNFSHGSHAEQLARLNMFKKVRDTLGAPVATILDTKGPEIRIKTFADGPVTLEQGQGFTPASVYFVNESVPEADRVRGQTVMMVASNGMGGMLGGLLAGWTLDMGGANWMLAACIACGCAGAALCWAALRCPARRTV